MNIQKVNLDFIYKNQLLNSPINDGLNNVLNTDLNSQINDGLNSNVNDGLNSYYNPEIDLDDIKQYIEKFENTNKYNNLICFFILLVLLGIILWKIF